MLAPWKKSYNQPRQHFKKQRHHYFANKSPSCQSYGFSSSHVWMWELDHKESYEWKLLSHVQLFATPWTIYSPWDSPGQNTGMGSLSLLQGIFPTQGLSPGLPHCRRILYQLSYQGSPKAAGRWRIDASELWCWRRLLRVPWTARSNWSILEEMSPE